MLVKMSTNSIVYIIFSACDIWIIFLLLKQLKNFKLFVCKILFFSGYRIPGIITWSSLYLYKGWEPLDPTQYTPIINFLYCLFDLIISDVLYAYDILTKWKVLCFINKTNIHKAMNYYTCFKWKHCSHSWMGQDN